MKPAPPTLFSLVVLSVGVFAGCTAPDNNDPLVADAQSAIATAKDAFPALEKADSDHQAALKNNANPAAAAALHLYAGVIRADSTKWLVTAQTALEAYQANKTDPTAAKNLKAATAVLDSATAESKRYLAAVAGPQRRL